MGHPRGRRVRGGPGPGGGMAGRSGRAGRSYRRRGLVMGKRILFVDDRPEFAHQPVARLRLEGYDVDEAGSGDDAMAALEKRRYDLLVFDADLPGSDGWHVLKWLRSRPLSADLKVLVFMAGKGET